MHRMTKEELNEDEAYGHNEPRLLDSLAKEYGPYADVSLPIDRVPEDIQRRMKKVFSKHEVSEIRDWAKKLMKSY